MNWLRIIAATLTVGFMASAVSAQEQNQWEFKGGSLRVARGWLDWRRNDMDGRYCLFSGHSGVHPENDVWCYDAGQNLWEQVFPGDQSATPPEGRDLHAWAWDHVGKEYFLFDGPGGQGGRQAFAFDLGTRTWRLLSDADFPGLDSRTRIAGSGIATSPDHDLMVIVQGGGTPTKVVRYLDLRNRTYLETLSDNPPARTNIQNQFLYISSIRKFLLFGGRVSSTLLLNDLWLLDPTTRTWMPIAHQNPPTPRANAQMAYDPVQDIVYLVGGDQGSERVSILHIANWTWEHLPAPAGDPLVDFPPLRRHGTAMFDPAAGFCNVAGALSGAAYWQSVQTWCFRHTVSADNVPPEAPPSGMKDFVLSNVGDLTATWQASPDDPGDVTNYEVQRSEDGGATWIDQLSVPANGSLEYSHTYQGVPDGPVRVRAVDAFGNRSAFVEVF